MLISEYARRVAESDQFKSLPEMQRRTIAIYGLVSEIGSVISAVKKRKLGEGGTVDTEQGLLTRHELRDELGDVMWYCFALARLDERLREDVLDWQLKKLLTDIEADDANGEAMRRDLSADKIRQFRESASAFPRKTKREFQDFQRAAYLTARTNSDELVEVCLAILMQLGAQIMRVLMPDSEREIHSRVGEPKMPDIIGDIAWHLAAIATVYELSLDEIAEHNVAKAQLRRPIEQPTPLHDTNRPPAQQFPRKCEIKFLTIGPRRSRMYLDSRQLGDDLTDNSYDPDGYRFHDSLHLANAVHLGWSPVLRSLMKRKRKDDLNPLLDVVEDGARAQIIEEALLKVIHSEGAEIAEILHADVKAEERQLFREDVQIPLSFFKMIMRYVKGLEVEKNSFEEWKSAIRDGHKIYQQLVCEGQGTVTLDLDRREINFRPDVYVDISGPVANVGSSVVALSEFDDDMQIRAISCLNANERTGIADNEVIPLAKLYMAKQAILKSIGVDNPAEADFQSLSITETDPGKFSVKAVGGLQERIWALGIITFKTSLSVTQSNVYCTALAVCDLPKT